MATYSAALKARLVKRMLPPESITVNALANETGITWITLKRWKTKGLRMPTMSKKNPASKAAKHRKTAEDKVRIVMEAASLSDEQLGELLRREGIHEVDLVDWRETAIVGATSALKGLKRKKSEQGYEAQQIRELKRDLQIKEKALAETAALLVLK